MGEYNKILKDICTFIFNKIELRFAIYQLVKVEQLSNDRTDEITLSGYISLSETDQTYYACERNVYRTSILFLCVCFSELQCHLAVSQQ